jgi:hypothetical protein
MLVIIPAVIVVCEFLIILRVSDVLLRVVWFVLRLFQEA